MFLFFPDHRHTMIHLIRKISQYPRSRCNCLGMRSKKRSQKNNSHSIDPTKHFYNLRITKTSIDIICVVQKRQLTPFFSNFWQNVWPGASLSFLSGFFLALWYKPSECEILFSPLLMSVNRTPPIQKKRMSAFLLPARPNIWQFKSLKLSRSTNFMQLENVDRQNSRLRNCEMIGRAIVSFGLCVIDVVSVRSSGRPSDPDVSLSCVVVAAFCPDFKDYRACDCEWGKKRAIVRKSTFLHLFLALPDKYLR